MGNNAQNPVDDESDMQVTLSLDDGSEVECAILTIFELEEQNYIALLPLDEDGNENEEGEVFRIYNDPMSNYSLSDNQVGKIYQDREGGVWIGTNAGGINYLSSSVLLEQAA